VLLCQISHKKAIKEKKLLKIGEILDHRYRILKKIAENHSHQVFLGEDTHRFNEYCVIKTSIISPQTDNIPNVQESQLLYHLNHSQIPQFKAFFAHKAPEQQISCLVEEYIDGTSYREQLLLRQQNNQSFSETEIIELFDKILPVLSYIHQQNLIHCQITPDNLILRFADQQPVLLNFAQAKPLNDKLTPFGALTDSQAETHPVTTILYQLGKVGYAPREQIEEGIVTPNSDLYSLGVTGLVLLTGKDPSELIHPKTLVWDWKSLNCLSPHLMGILTRMLAQEPSDRFPDALEVLSALQQSPSSFSTEETDVTSSVSPNPPVTSPSLLDSETMTSTSPPIRNPLFGCFGKIFLVLAVILGSGGLGWWGAKAWLNQKLFPEEIFTSEQPKILTFPSPVTVPASPTLETPGISSDEVKRRQALRARRVNLGIDQKYFIALVDQYFFVKYPERVGKNFSNSPQDAEWRKLWDEIAAKFLDKLEILSPRALQKLGRYNRTRQRKWIRQVNQLHLSSVALFDLADAKFFAHFPEQQNQGFHDQPIGQVWKGITWDTLNLLQEGKIYQKLPTTGEVINHQLRVRLLPGEGRAYVIQLQSSQTMTVQLTGDPQTQLSIYSPTRSVKILEDSSQKSWSGTLPETGYYELVIVSQGKNPLNYQLNLTVK
jgi:serine/threonine-protein kinase